VVVKRGESYALRWTYGEWGFFFQPEYRVREGALWFSVQGTSSSGALTGRTVEMAIEKPKAIAALQNGGAFWWEPDRTTVRLAIVEEIPEPMESGRHEDGRGGSRP